ncbi:murein biosynthesis integral membrane protein MurJ [Candidatus Viridilinea mediisalina]|uniref:Probable lipid II flippase MurJ n=1 Tax=Candidatus Viridilinea mediisalina TaxID=2024553 RepID=A0A2A6RLG7_9CHLR|nr:murein biosynthesis integral membrane protein MurJ [Candidatus Viridilinea mediisalina]PDW03954.1 murein biosynthesis integral membrane protein MurJ [Candidatus Viridilinea mediisalina]
MQLSSLLRRARTGALGSSLIVMGGFVLSRVTGLLRDVVATYVYGTSVEAAAYRAAFSVVDLLYLVIIGGALGSSFIPVFIEVWERDGQARAWRLASAVVTWALVALSVASALLFVAAPWLVQLIYGGRGFDAATLTLTVQLTRLFLLSPLLLGLGGLAMAALNAREHFTLPALAPTIYNLGIIGGALLGPPLGLGIWGMAWGVVLGALGYLLVQIPGLRGLGMHLRLQLGRGIREVGRIARQMGPRVVGQAAAHISIVVTLALTARLDDGAAKLAGLGYAYQLMLLPFGIFSLSLSQVAFPRLARLVAEGRQSELAADLRRTLGMILWLTLPASAMLLSLGMPLARVLFERGAYDAISLQYTVSALLGYSLALPAFAASEILIRGFYAMQRTWIPVIVGLLQVGLNLGLGLLLLNAGGDVGSLALAFSIANNLEALLLIALMGRALPGIWRDPGHWRTVSVALLGATVVGLGLSALRSASTQLVPALSLSHSYQWTDEIIGLLLWLSAAGSLGAIAYLMVSIWLGAAPARVLIARWRIRGG